MIKNCEIDDLMDTCSSVLNLLLPHTIKFLMNGDLDQLERACLGIPRSSSSPSSSQPQHSDSSLHPDSENEMESEPSDSGGAGIV